MKKNVKQIWKEEMEALAGNLNYFVENFKQLNKHLSLRLTYYNKVEEFKVNTKMSIVLCTG